MGAQTGLALLLDSYEPCRGWHQQPVPTSVRKCHLGLRGSRVWHPCRPGKDILSRLPLGAHDRENCCRLGEWVFQPLFILGTEREHERGRGRERGRHRIGNRLQALSHQPRARRGAQTHGPRDRDLAEVGRLTDCATQAPRGMGFVCVLCLTAS